jgi:pectin methylesterase-like acyl-CoA thioesterase
MQKTLKFFCVFFFCLFVAACKKATEIEISVTTEPAKTIYYEGETFDTTGMVVKVNLSDGTSKEITEYQADKTVLGADDTTVTISYGSFSTTVQITVHAQTGITVTTNPDKLSYRVGESFDATGMVVKVNYADNTSRTITDYTVDKTVLAATDDKVTITYGRFSTTVDISIITQTGIAVTTNPTKLVYYEGEEFDPEGMEVKVNYSDDSSAVITDYTIDPEVLGGDDEVVTIRYGNLTATVAITVYAATELVIETQPSDLEYVEGESFDPAGMVIKVKYADNTSKVITDYQLDKDVLTPADRTVKVTYLDLEATISIKVKTTDGFDMIYTVEELLALIQKSTLDGKYRLGSDINGENVTWVTPTSTLTGTFDGNNHTIMNVTLSLTSSKRGILFNKVNDGTVKNIRFDTISVTSNQESAAIIAGVANGNTTFENLEFTNCSVETTGNYCALIFARNETTAGTINVNKVTVKNNCSLKSTSYGAGLLGDIKSGSTLNVKNIDFNASLQFTGTQGGLLSGRDRGNTTQNFENIRIRATISGTNKLGVFSDGTGSGSTITIKNVIILGLELTSTYDTDVDAWKGMGTNVPTLNNCYFVKDNIKIQLKTKQSNTIATDINGTANGSTGVFETDVDISFYQNDLQLDFTNAWEVDGEDIKLIGSSTNQVGENDVLESIRIISNSSKTYYVVGDDFDSEGLIVKGRYSNGVEATLSSELYTVDASAFVKSVAGEYTIVVKVGELEATYTVTVVVAVSFNVYDEFVVKTYLVGGKLSTSGLYVRAVMNDGSEHLIDNYQITNNFNGELAGVYQVSIAYKNFPVYTYDVTVIASSAPVVDNKVEIVVDKGFAGVNGQVVDGKPVFKTLTAMIEYLNACDYDDAVRKIIHIKNGNYVEKITFGSNLKNITLIGESKEGTILSYYVCSDHLQPNGSPWGTQGSSSVTIKSEGFEAINITFKNTFDYFGDTKYANKQGVAVCVEADKVIFDNCAFYGVQDTLYAKWGRQYYVNCYIEGSVDFIFGNNATVLFENCTIHSISRNSSSNNGYITAHKGTHTGNDKGDYGYVFKNCNFTAATGVPAGTVALGRPWDKNATVAFIGCQMGAHISKVAYTNADGMERYEIMSGNSPVDADFKEYGNTGEGALTEAVTGMTMLTTEQAAAYTITNIFASTNGQITWTASWNADLALTALRNLLP